MKSTNTTQPWLEKSPLYAWVYSSAPAAYIACLLIFIFFFQTIQRAYAADDVTAGTENPAPITDELLSRIEDTPVTPLTAEQTANLSSTIAEPVSEVTPVAQASPESPPPNETPPAISDGTSTISDTIISPHTDSLSSKQSTQEVDSEQTATQANTSPSVPDIPVTASLDLTKNSSTTIASTSIIDSLNIATTTIQAPLVMDVHSDAVLQFSKNNCVAVADGSFYCQAASNTAPEADGLYSLPDADGDLEIYLKHAGTMTQVTHNTVDDASPYFDQTSNTIVWHRFIDDRYQIMSYDLAAGKEEQLTDTTANNMEPYRAGSYTVWQHWDNDAWQIMLYDGSAISQLTHSVEHNIAPSIRNGLVLWHRVYSNEQIIEVYDLNTKTLMSIKNSDGATISNPRMVLVFDETDNAGGAVTKGYDLLTGEITDFAESPKPLPDNIPDPEASGTTKALVHPKSTEDESDSSLSINSNPGGASPLLSNVATDSAVFATTTADLTLDLTAASSAEAGSSQIVSTSTDISHIDDIVVPSFSIVGTTSTSTLE